jgi:hypothetical protein
MQPADATSCFFSRAITLDTDCWLWFRATCEWQSQKGIASNIQTQFLCGFAEQADLAAHYVYINVGQTEAGGVDYAATAGKSDGGGAALVGLGVLAQTGQPIPGITQGFIQKNGADYYFFAGNDDGIWSYIGTHTFAGNTLDTLLLRGFDDGGTPGSSLINVDFVRYGTGVVIRP